MKRSFFFFVGFSLITMLMLSIGCKGDKPASQSEVPVAESVSAEAAGELYTSYTDVSQLVAFAVPSTWKNMAPTGGTLPEEGLVAMLQDPDTKMSLNVVRTKQDYAAVKAAIDSGDTDGVRSELEAGLKQMLPEVANVKVHVPTDTATPSLYATHEAVVQDTRLFQEQRMFLGNEEVITVTVTRPEGIPVERTEEIMKTIYLVKR